MKILILSLFALFVVNGAIGQNYTEPAKIAKVSSQNISADTIQYMFLSNYFIDSYKAPMLEGRLLKRYSEILEINIDAETQTVTFKTLNSGSSIFLNKFVTHFKYSGYEIH